MLTVLLGGARAGKSHLAEQWASASGQPVVVIATGVAFDDEMTARIDRHRADRPSDWATIEEPTNLAEALESVPAHSTVIVECLTTWLGNLVHLGETPADLASDAALTVALGHSGRVIAISNEVGMGIVPVSDVAREYRDQLGRINQQWCAAADEAFLVVAGRTLQLHDLVGQP